MTGLLIFYLKKDDSSRWMVALGGILVSAMPISLLFVKNNPFNIPIIIGYYVFVFCTTFLGSSQIFMLILNGGTLDFTSTKASSWVLWGLPFINYTSLKKREKMFQGGSFSFLFSHFQSLPLFFGKYMSSQEISLLLIPCSEAVTKIPCTI